MAGRISGTSITSATPQCLQVFDVASFDMIAMVRLPWVPAAVEWCFRRGTGDARAKLAVASSGSGAIHVFDVRRSVVFFVF